MFKCNSGLACALKCSKDGKWRLFTEYSNKIVCERHGKSAEPSVRVNGGQYIMKLRQWRCFKCLFSDWTECKDLGIASIGN